MASFTEYEVGKLARDFAAHPILGPATRTLSRLRDCVNQNSGGPDTWPGFSSAAQTLTDLIARQHLLERYGFNPDATPAQVRNAYAPIREFLSRAGLNCEIESL